MMLSVLKEREKEKEQQQQSKNCLWVALIIYIISIEPCEITFHTNGPKQALYSSNNITQHLFADILI